MSKIGIERSPETSAAVRALKYELEDYAFSVYSEELNKLTDEELACDRLSSEERRYALLRLKCRKKRLLPEVEQYIAALNKHEAAYFSFKVPEFNFPKFKHR